MPDPIEPKLAWEPADPSVWDRRWAAHLYRRAAFGFPARMGRTPAVQQLDAAVDRGRDACIEELLTGGERAGSLDDLMDSLGAGIAGKRPGRFQEPGHEKLRGWWLYRMIHTPHPLRERMTLFWHDHFATSIAKVGSMSLMFRQNRLLREHALGHFGPLLRGISRDPAMIVWLDSQKNVKGRPNENFAREIMELFSLGVGNYTEKDIQEVARCFTGWSVNGEDFQLNRSVHDEGDKSVLGTKGPLDGDGVVEILLGHPATAQYLVRKLYAEFVSEVDEPSEELLEPLVTAFKQSDYDVAALLRTMLTSRLFFSEHAYRRRVKSPAEYVVGLVRAFDGSPKMEQLARGMDGLGQSLFAPPNVAGWDAGPSWLNSATLLARHNFAARFVSDEVPGLSVDVQEYLAEQEVGEPRQRVEFLLDLLLQGDVPPEARNQLEGYASKDATDASRLRQLAHTILLIPEFQLA